MTPSPTRVAAVTLALLTIAIGARPARAQNPARAADRAAVERAVLDYVEGFYEGDTTKLARSVSPTVYKYGYYKEAGVYKGEQMPFENFLRFARGVQAGRNKPPAGASKDIVLFDVQDQTASAKLTAWWGTDYLLLGKQNGTWMITHVTWQTPPPKE